MELKLDNNNLIIGYAKVGGFDNGVYISDLDTPESFEDDFKKGYYKYDETNKKIIINENYNPETSIPDIPQNIPDVGIPDIDNSQIKKMVSTLQKQGVKNNLIISNILKENEDLKNKIANLESNQGGGGDGTE